MFVLHVAVPDGSVIITFPRVIRTAIVAGLMYKAVNITAIWVHALHLLVVGFLLAGSVTVALR